MEGNVAFSFSGIIREEETEQVLFQKKFEVKGIKKGPLDSLKYETNERRKKKRQIVNIVDYFTH